jgi:hypothetical protein
VLKEIEKPHWRPKEEGVRCMASVQVHEGVAGCRSKEIISGNDEE